MRVPSHLTNPLHLKLLMPSLQQLAEIAETSGYSCTTSIRPSIPRSSSSGYN